MRRSVEGVLLLCFKSISLALPTVWEFEVHKNLRHLCVYNPIHTKVHLSLLTRTAPFSKSLKENVSVLRRFFVGFFFLQGFDVEIVANLCLYNKNIIIKYSCMQIKSLIIFSASYYKYEPIFSEF